MNSESGQGNRSIARAGAYESLVLMASNLNQTVGGLSNTKTIDLVHVAAILGIAMPRTGNHLMCFRHEAGTATGIPWESKRNPLMDLIQVAELSLTYSLKTATVQSSVRSVKVSVTVRVPAVSTR